MEESKQGAEQLRADNEAPAYTITEERLNGFLSAAFGSRPGWVVQKREQIPSFQQYLERIQIDWPELSDSVAEKTEVTVVRCETIFLRVYRGLMSWWTLATPDLPQREQAAWRVAARAGVPVPDTLWTMESPDISVALQRLSPGRPVVHADMTDAMEVSLGRMLARLHRARVGAADRLPLPDITLASLFPRLISWAEEASANELTASAQRLQTQFREEIIEQPPVFLHGDFHDGNVLVDTNSGDVTAVIDWEEAAYGDPRLDICVMERVLRRRFNGAGQTFLAAYQEASGIAPGHLKLWEELCGVRSRIVGAWVKDRIERGHALPTVRPEAWF